MGFVLGQLETLFILLGLAFKIYLSSTRTVLRPGLINSRYWGKTFYLLYPPSLNHEVFQSGPLWEPRTSTLNPVAGWFFLQPLVFPLTHRHWLVFTWVFEWIEWTMCRSPEILKYSSFSYSSLNSSCFGLPGFLA